RLGVAPDSVDRFLNVVNGIGAAPESRYEGNRKNDQLSGMLRVDYLISNRHTLMLRGDIRNVGQEPTRVSATSLPETGADNVTDGGGLMASLSSQFGQRAINQFRVYASSNERVGDPYWYLPQGRVQVGSEFDDGSTGINTLSMGGNTSAPTSAKSKSVEVADELSVFPGGASHRLKLGVLFRAEESTDFASTNQWGTYTFRSLEALETGTAASYRRILNAPERKATMLEWAVYGGDVWMPSRTFQVNYGVRAEITKLKNPPAYNAAVDASLSVRTDRLPSEFDVSPRAGFTWQVGATGFATPPAFIISGGVGKFRSPMQLGLVSQAQSGTGLQDSETILECTGPYVPAPNWESYRLDPTAIPDACLGTPTVIDLNAPVVTAFSEDYKSAKSWRASLGVQRSLTTLIRASVNFTYARGVHQYGYRDVNLNTEGGFAIAAEENRPVFVPASTIPEQTGEVNSRVSRVDSSFAQVLEIGSHLENDSKQLTLSLGGVTRNGIVLRTSYTWSRVRDQSSLRGGGGGGGGGRGGFGGAGSGGTTSGNPNVPEWGRSSLERRHSFLLTVSYPFGPSLDVTAIGRLSSGRPYTPIVATDINGDGAANDQAFVFDPATTPGMEQLLQSTSSGARNCLTEQIGTIANRNSCLGPWEGTLEFQINYRPSFWGLNHRLMVSLTTINLLGGVDRLLHGSDGLKGWGMRASPDSRLLYVTGFDQAAQEFVYAVNERFGASDPQRTAFQQPFQIGIQARLSLGPDRARDALLGMRGGRGMGMGGGMRGGMGAGGFRGGITGGADFLDRFSQLLVNPAEYVLELVDSLDLSHEQIERLAFLRDSLGGVNDSIGTALRTEIEEAAGGAQQDPRALMEVIRPRMQEAVENLQRGLGAVREVLTEEQWELLPERVRNLGSQRGRQGGMRRPDG
ncbi:MAG: hypothetical protein PVH40_06095, partial [Gemmatimonadales bacterium]